MTECVDLPVKRYDARLCNPATMPDDCLMQPVNERPAEHFKVTQPHTRLDLERILKARQEISRVFRDTPQFDCPALGNLLGCELVIKLETANPIGCFKGRGTEVVASRLARSPGPKAAVCASAVDDDPIGNLDAL